MPPATPPAEPSAEEEPKKKPTCKICCACPETRKARDECVLLHGEEECGERIEEHRACLRAEGFDV